MSGQTKEFDITGMHCAACVARVEKVVGRLDGVDSVKVNLLTRKGSVTYKPGSTLTADDVVKAITSIGFGAAPAAEGEIELKKVNLKPSIIRLVIAAVMAIPMMASMIGSFAFGWPMLPAWVELVLATIAQFGPGLVFYQGAFGAIRGGALTMDVLVVLGTTVAYVFSMLTWTPSILVFETSHAIGHHSGVRVQYLQHGHGPSRAVLRNVGMAHHVYLAWQAPRRSGQGSYVGSVGKADEITTQHGPCAA